MKRLKYFSIALLLCLIGNLAKAQNRQVQGIVRDAQGPLPGITVHEKGMTANGVATDIDGRFRITLRGDADIIVIRGVGYITREISVKDKSTVDVTLEVSSQDLSEVAVIGYGTQKKITLTGAQSAVSGRDIRENPSASLQNTLAGRVTGFISQQRSGQPGSDGASFLVRGQTALNGNNNPLIIVDDVEYSYDLFARLDPNEVESITILKDAAQTAVYGIKGANGVVVVTTRRGTVGKARISVRNDYAISEFTKLPTYLDSYNTALLVNQANANDGKPATYTDQDIELFKNGQDPYGHPNNNWKDLLFKDRGTQYKTTFDVQGGTEKVKYFVSLSYLDQGGMTKDYSQGQGYNGTYYNRRYNYRSNLDINVDKNLSLRVDAYGNIGQINRPNIFYNNTLGQKNDVFYEYSSFLGMSPMNYPIKNPDGSWGYSVTQRGQSIYAAPNLIQRLTYDGYLRSNENNMVVSTSANENLGWITNGLSLKGTLAYTNNYTNNISLTRADLPSYIYDPVNKTYSLTDPNVSRMPKLGTNYQPGSTQRRLTAQGFLTYDRSFKYHHVSALALYSLSSFTASSGDANYNFIPNNTLGYTGRIGYDYKSKYIVQFSGAYNGSSRFTGNKTYGFFPSGSVAYNIAEEPFFKKALAFVDQFKIRGSYGLVGSDAIGGSFTYAYLQNYTQTNGNQGAFSFGDTHSGSLLLNQGIQEGTLPNQNVTWDKQKELDLGVDFGFFGNKLTGQVDYFRYNRYDQLITRGTVSAMFGQGLPPVNLGRTETKGLEIELNYRNTIGKNFSYNLRGTYSRVKNKMTFTDEPSVLYPWQAYTGHPIGAEARYHFIGYYKDAADVAASAKPVNMLIRPGDLKYQDLNADNVIDSKDQAVSDITNVPTDNYGLQVGFGYKNFNVNLLFQGASNFNVRAAEEAIRAFSSNFQAVHQTSWTPALGDNATYPLLTQNRGVSDPSAYNSDYWSVSGNYVRLRTAEISYNAPLKLVQKLRLQGARIYLSGNNLITWSKAFKLYDLDPEFSPGITNINYPPQKMFNLGLSITFN